MTKTIAIQIGNSDDKLSQKDWSEFVAVIDRLINSLAKEVHFFGTPANFAPWQNAAWIFMIEDERIGYLREELVGVRKHFNQDSIAWSECKTEFI